MDWPVLDVSHQRNHTPCVFLCLFLSLSIVFSGFVHVVASVRASAFARLSGVPMCGGTLELYLPLGSRGRCCREHV